MAAGEIPKAFVVLKKGMTVTEEEIMEFVKQRVAPSKAVREVEFRTELPMTLVGKVLRKVLQEEGSKNLKHSLVYLSLNKASHCHL
jgi:long-chain acyl-CoA synthetase